VLAVAGLVAIAGATLTPSDAPHGEILGTSLFCLVCGDQGIADVAANLLLFLPFATGLRLAGWSWLRTVAAAALVSFSVEALQFLVVTGREASLSDLLTNTLSGAIGAALGGVLPGLAAPTPARAARLLASALVAPLALLGVWAWLLGSDIPPGELLSHWAHESPEIDTFDGRVRAVRFNGRTMPANEPPPDSARLRQEVVAGRIALEADVISGAPTVAKSWIYMLRVPLGAAVLLGQRRRVVVFDVPSRALRYRLFSPSVSLVDGLPAEGGTAATLRATERGRDLVLSSSYGGFTRTVALGITPAYGWSLIAPFQFPGGTARWITALFLALLYFPAGYWAASTGRPATAAAAVASGIGLALVALSPLAGLSPAPWSEWFGSLAGASLGWALRRAGAYLEERCASPSDIEFSSS
jgi:hypothetical protein